MPQIAAPDLADPRFKADPHPFYARLRTEAPVFRAALPDKREAWLVTRYDDVAALLKDGRFAKDPRNAVAHGRRPKTPWLPPGFGPLSRNMLDLDDPDHARLRMLVHKAFTPRLVEGLRGRIQALADGLLDAPLRAGRSELVADYALPLPATVIAELLGVPSEDQRRFHRWSRRTVAVASGRDALRAAPALWAYMRYLRGLFAQRRAEPRDDLITALVRAEEAGDRLDRDELVAMGVLLLTAGHETTVNLIGNGVLGLLRAPDQLALLRSQPELAGNAVEEMLRHDSPVQMTRRVTLTPYRVGEVEIPAGAFVIGSLGAANRDPAHWGDDADELRIERPDARQHLSFGAGHHHCLGAALARLEGRVAFSRLVQRFETLEQAGDVEWNGRINLRGPERLPVRAA